MKMTRTALVLAVLLLASVCQAAEVTLQWDTNSPAPDGYRIYQRSEPGTYNAPAWTGTATTATITGLAEGVPYYFVARAFAGAEESGNSNEVRFLALPAPTIAPVPSPTPEPTPKCFPISGSGGFISTIAPGEYTIEDGGKTWTLTIVDALPKFGFSGNTASKTFHKPGCRYYQCATCTERFATKDEAIAAGYRPCGICKP